MENQIETALMDLKELLGKGQFIQAMEKYLADDVVLQEANNEPKIGKEVCLQAEKDLLDTVTDFGGYTIKNIAIDGNISYYEAIMDFTTKDGTKHHFEQVNRTEWKDGKIVNERYYHA
ncbi:MAG: SnoaL-like domain-containing protein [Bacteroidota bacterium]